MVRIGIIGAGNTFAVSHIHAKAINQNENCEISAILSCNIRNSERLRQQFCPNAIICTSWEEFQTLVDAVCICTPNCTHASYAIKALRAGKAVMCEKPVGGTSEEIMTLEELASGTNIVNVVGYNYRYQEPFIIIRNLIAAGELGSLYWYSEQKGGNRLADETIPFEWRMSRESGGGATMDFCSHMVDHFCYLSSIPISKLNLDECKCRTYIRERKNAEGEDVPVKTEDYTLLSLTAPDSISIVLTASRVGIPDEQVEVVGSRGMVRYSTSCPRDVYFYRKSEHGYTDAPIKISCSDNLQESYNQQMDQFIDAILRREQIHPNLMEGCKIYRLLLRAIVRGSTR